MNGEFAPGKNGRRRSPPRRRVTRACQSASVRVIGGDRGLSCCPSAIDGIYAGAWREVRSAAPLVRHRRKKNCMENRLSLIDAVIALDSGSPEASLGSSLSYYAGTATGQTVIARNRRRTWRSRGLFSPAHWAGGEKRKKTKVKGNTWRSLSAEITRISERDPAVWSERVPRRESYILPPAEPPRCAKLAAVYRDFLSLSMLQPSFLLLSLPPPSRVLRLDRFSYRNGVS
ncbi:hypothetical protein MRX96_005246 [Rhipicephalus microplus]